MEFLKPTKITIEQYIDRGKLSDVTVLTLKNILSSHAIHRGIQDLLADEPKITEEMFRVVLWNISRVNNLRKPDADTVELTLALMEICLMILIEDKKINFIVPAYIMEEKFIFGLKVINMLFKDQLIADTYITKAVKENFRELPKHPSDSNIVIVKGPDEECLFVDGKSLSGEGGFHFVEKPSDVGNDVTMYLSFETIQPAKGGVMKKVNVVKATAVAVLGDGLSYRRPEGDWVHVRKSVDLITAMSERLFGDPLYMETLYDLFEANF